MTKYRIVVKDGLYMPQEKKWWGWDDFYFSGCQRLEFAESVIKQKIIDKTHPQEGKIVKEIE